MNASHEQIRITLRIPGNWKHPAKLVERLPAKYRLTEDSLILPDGTSIEFTPLRPDDQFASIFRSSCRRPATPDELSIVDSYTINIALTGPGGSMDRALTMMRAAAAIVQAGGAGVFIDNSALAHGASGWIEMAEDGSPDALSFGFVGIVRGRQKIWTMGMHVLGFADLEVRNTEGSEEVIIESLRYICHHEKPVGDGHVIADEQGPRFQVVAMPNDEFDAGSPMYNPWGRLRLESFKGIAEDN